jgi:hypothetical protein
MYEMESQSPNSNRSMDIKKVPCQSPFFLLEFGPPGVQLHLSVHNCRLGYSWTILLWNGSWAHRDRCLEQQQTQRKLKLRWVRYVDRILITKVYTCCPVCMAFWRVIRSLQSKINIYCTSKAPNFDGVFMKIIFTPYYFLSQTQR